MLKVMPLFSPKPVGVGAAGVLVGAVGADSEAIVKVGVRVMGWSDEV